MKKNNFRMVSIEFVSWEDRPKTSKGYCNILRKIADEMENGNAVAYSTTHDKDGNYNPHCTISINE